MYIFVFMWTPELERLNPALSHGFVFAVFMIWKMAGSYIFLVGIRVCVMDTVMHRDC